MCFKIFIITIVSLYIQIKVISSKKYLVKHDRLELEYWNKDYLKSISIEHKFFNRSQKVVNADFVLTKNFTEKYACHVQFYEFRSNEYHIFAPVRFAINLCQVLKTNPYNALNDILKNSNFPKVCFGAPGHYYLRNFVIPQHPDYPYFKPGHYKSENILIVKFWWFGSIERLYGVEKN